METDFYHQKKMSTPIARLADYKYHHYIYAGLQNVTDLTIINSMNVTNINNIV